ncbi:MAG: fatty acid desaturase [Bdellovibrionales bacterium]|nr:fatty acid desaturase [Bdellovibrionales bacterium]
MTNFIEIRKRVSALDPELPLRAKHPTQLALGAAWLAIALALGVWNLARETNWAIQLLSGIGIGIALSVLTFFNHELLHGSIVKSRRLAHVLAYPGFFVFALSPELWITWHNHLHHYHANQTGGYDPDLAGDWNRLKNRKIGPPLVKYLMPGAGHPLVHVFNTMAFSLQCLNVTWLRSRERPELYRSMNRGLMVAETLAYYAIWIALFVALPFGKFFFLLLVPAAIVNAVVFNTVGLPHNMRPLTEDNLPMAATITLESPRIVNWMFFNFSYHIEHHVFPEANHSILPRIGAHLRREYSEEYTAVPHGRAIRAFYSTPRAYFDADHLFYPDTGEKVDLAKLRRDGFRRR